MVSLRLIRTQFTNLMNIESVYRSNIQCFERKYSVFPKYYTKPIFRKEELEAVESSEELKTASYLSFLPTFVSQTSSEFYDPLVTKLINYLTKQGKKVNARILVEKAFQRIKILQLQAYHTAPLEQQENIELDPKVILKAAIQNAEPVLELIKVIRGGQTYQVPTPIDARRSRFLAFKWIIQTAKEKKSTEILSHRIADELILAYKNQGRVIRKKHELYKQCQANKSYAHFRWT